MPLLLFALLLATCMTTTGCGGSGDNNSPVTLTLLSIESLSGSVEGAGQVTPGTMVVGDIHPPGSPELHFRGFVTFDLSPIPAGATLTSATLTLNQVRVSGDPYATLSFLLIDHVVFGTLLDGGAYSRTYPTDQGVLLSANATIGPKTIEATTQVLDDLGSGRTLSQYRVRFVNEGDGDANVDQSELGGSSSVGSSPTLVVTYTR